MAALERIGKKRTAPGTHFVLCGPSGCGKSVLLSELRAAAQKMGGVDVVRIPAKSLATEEGLNRVFVAAWPQTEAPQDLLDSLLARTDPASPNSRALLLLLDEVQATPRPIHPNGADLLFHLLDAVQTVCGEGLKRPVLLVAAGTPDTPQRLRDAEASSGDRLFSIPQGGETPIFLLPEPASELALWQPLADFGRRPPLGCEKRLGGTLSGRVQSLTSGHPYLIQMLGDRLHQALLKSAPDAAEIPADAFERAAEAYKEDRNDHHVDVFGDLTDRGLGECAALVAHKMLRNGLAVRDFGAYFM